jgi:hypothetical protein
MYSTHKDGICTRTWRVSGRVVNYVIRNFVSILQGLLVLVICLFFLNMLHESTYVWQSTVGNGYLAPTARTTCNIGLLPNSPTVLPGKPKIALVVLYGGDWPSGLMQRVKQNKEFYCKYHGYTLIDGNSYVDSSRPVAWSKLLAVDGALNR